jgi:hypothetical protein
MGLTYLDDVTGQRRAKRRYVWGLTGLVVGLTLGLIIGSLLH